MTTRKLVFILQIITVLITIRIQAQNEPVVSKFYSDNNETDSINNLRYSIQPIHNITINPSIAYNNKVAKQPYEIYLNTGIYEKNICLTYSAYLDQTKDNLNLTIEEGTYSFLKIVITTMAGNVLLEGGTKGGNTIISMLPFPNGAYILSVLQESNKLKSFIIIKN